MSNVEPHLPIDLSSMRCGHQRTGATGIRWVCIRLAGHPLNEHHLINAKRLKDQG